ncbi:MAG: N-acetylglucosamine kinase, partial [Terriglobia bacterium]
MTSKKAVPAKPQARSQPRYFIGIDGGGSRTTAWLADEYGHVCARAEAAASNPLKTGIAASQKELVDAALGALRKAGVGAREVTALCAGVAGVDRSPVRRKIITALRSAIFAPHFLLTTDAAITLQSAFGKEPGIVVISGTGSIAYGRDRSGRTVRVGGWGSVFDDAGSGYDLGRKAVAAALNDMDGCGPKTALREALSKTLKLRSIAQVAGREWTPGEIAALFPVMLEVARRGDRVAQG